MSVGTWKGDNQDQLFSKRGVGLFFLEIMNKLIDRFARQINYLRLSVTDRCNLRCVYCMPPSGILHKAQETILTFEEIYRIVRIAADLGIDKVRITGGEPLVRKDMDKLIEKLRPIASLKEIALTTNGIYLDRYATSLKAAGLDRVNISLDTLRPDRFYRITRGGDLDRVLRGIESALSAGLSPVKINVVLLNGFNTDEISAFASLTKSRPIHVRFIEYMDTRLSIACSEALELGISSYEELFSNALEAKRISAALGELHPVYDEQGGPASVFRIDGFLGTLGFISPISEPFCASCNKLRLESDGVLRSCLHSSEGVDLKMAMAEGASDPELASLIREAVVLKPESHNLPNVPLGDSKKFSMCQIGG